ncbi:unnamed protein product [Musa hybrid cultivar]
MSTERMVAFTRRCQGSGLLKGGGTSGFRPDIRRQ